MSERLDGTQFCASCERLTRERDALRQVEVQRLRQLCDERAEVERLRYWNEKVRVCKDHTVEIVDDEKGCAICEIERLRALLREWIDRAEGQKASRPIVDLISDIRAALGEE